MMTEAGLHCATTCMRDYWIPVDKYVIRTNASEECVLSDGLKDVREQIIKGTPDEKQWYKTTIQKAQKFKVGASSPCIRKICQCKGGRCTRRCRCLNKLLLNMNARVFALATATAMDEGKFLIRQVDI